MPADRMPNPIRVKWLGTELLIPGVIESRMPDLLDYCGECRAYHVKLEKQPAFVWLAPVPIPEGRMGEPYFATLGVLLCSEW